MPTKTIKPFDKTELFYCPYQPGGLKLSRTACASQHKKSKELLNSNNSDGFSKKNLIEGSMLKTCAKCKIGQKLITKCQTFTFKKGVVMEHDNNNLERIIDCPNISHQSDGVQTIVNDPPIIPEPQTPLPGENNRNPISFNPQTHKMCNKCKLILPLVSFGWKNKTKNIRDSRCRQCDSTKKPVTPITQECIDDNKNVKLNTNIEPININSKQISEIVTSMLEHNKNLEFPEHSTNTYPYLHDSIFTEIEFKISDSKLYSKLKQLATIERRTIEQQIMWILEEKINSILKNESLAHSPSLTNRITKSNL